MHSNKTLQQPKKAETFLTHHRKRTYEKILKHQFHFGNKTR